MRAPCRAVGEAHRRYAGFVNARARVTVRDDALVSVAPALERAPRFADLLVLSLAEQMALEGFEPKSANGRPLGPPAIVAAVEAKLGRSLQPG